MPRFSGGWECSGDDSTTPFTAMVPVVGRMKPAIIRNVVVLPQPLGPSRETNSPWPMDRLTSCTAGVLPKLLPRPFRTSLLNRGPASA